MTRFFSKVKSIYIDKKRRKQAQESVTKEDILSYQSLAGALLWLGSAVMPQASSIATLMQQKITRLRVCDLLDANARLHELRNFKSNIRYNRVRDGARLKVCTFSDASFNISEHTSYGQTVLISGLPFDANRGSRGTIFHAIDWTSTKQCRVSHSSYGAEIIACAEAHDRGYHLKQAIQTIFPSRRVMHELKVDSKGLYDTITTLHERKEYRLGQTVQRISDSFESEELYILKWIQGSVNIAEELTKHNPESFKLISKVLTTGRL